MNIFSGLQDLICFGLDNILDKPLTFEICNEPRWIEVTLIHCECHDLIMYIPTWFC